MENTAIAWCDNTFNPWVGCTKVAPACEPCYAAARDDWLHAGAHWGPGAPRARTSPANWALPAKWNREAERTGIRPRVFCMSLGDWADNEVPDEWRADLFRVWRETPNILWLPLTKRIGNALKMLPREWPRGFEHVGMMATMASQDEVERDKPKLLGVPARWHGVSIEPQLGPVAAASLCGLDWAITGGMSQQAGAAPIRYDVGWARELVNARGYLARTVYPAIFVKQMGSWPVQGGIPLNLRDKAGADMREWPQDLRVQEYPLALSRERLPP